MRIGILEFRDNDFIRSVTEKLAGLEVEFIQANALAHPSPSPYRAIIDRVSFCDPFLRELVRYWSLTGTYVINNPFFTLTFDKLTELLWYDSLSIPHPLTVLLPRPNPAEDLQEIIGHIDWEAIAAKVGFPCILKPVDGYAWQDVFRVNTIEELRTRYEMVKNRQTLIVQQFIDHSDYYRAFCVNGRDVLVVQWNPAPLDGGVYKNASPQAVRDVRDFIVTKTAALNSAMGLDFNSVEWCITPDRRAHVIDSFNDVPDVRKERLPPEAYDWVVERFCACVRSKAASGEINAMRISGPAGSGAYSPPG